MLKQFDDLLVKVRSMRCQPLWLQHQMMSQMQLQRLCNLNTPELLFTDTV